MCTTGVLRIGDGDYLLFKNKDFGRTHFDDRLVTEPSVFGVQGVTTWAGTDPDLDQFSGFSIGANEHGLLCCDSNVRTLDGHANYDELTEIALREGRDVDSAVAAVQEAVESKPYLWANLIMIDAVAAAAVEVRGDRTEVTALAGPAARSNHHIALKPHPDDDDTVTTQRRLASAQRRLDEAGGIDDIFALQRSHDDGDTGICNHQGYRTVYSYVLRHRAGSTSLRVAQGQPCTKPEVVELTVPLGALWSAGAASDFRSSYPSAQAVNDL
ncbi:MAG: hypothetical protein F4X85_04830 [Acidimicrobiaceae bacterium]|nr:hypothetical protein [Acidimicrobiaceae bacterium]